MRSVGTHCRCPSAGLSALKALSLVGCGLTVSMPGPGLDRLRRLSELELCNGSFTVSNADPDAGKLCGQLASEGGPLAQ